LSNVSDLAGHSALLVSVHTRRFRKRLQPVLPVDDGTAWLDEAIDTDEQEPDVSDPAGLHQLDAIYAAKADPRAETYDFVELALAAGLNSGLTLEFNVKQPTSNYYLGKGQVEIVKEHAQQQGVELVAINAPLSSVHQRNWEQELKLPVLNRHDLIFAIFQSNAHTAEGKLQVELARLKYELPRIVRSYEKLDPLAGGIGTIGPGEQLTERIKRVHRKRIQEIEARLVKLRSQRALRRKQRDDSGLFTISIVGYTNVGKSTLLNRLTSGGVLVADQYFATLDPTVRNLRLPDGERVLLTDTVGFISDLPQELLTSFRATLDEMEGSDLLLHLADASHPQVNLQITSVRRIVEEIGLGGIPELLVFNKADRVSAEECNELALQWTGARFVSAVSGQGIGALLRELIRLNENFLLGSIVKDT
jgi:GTP-binding protein HflX